MCMVVLQAEKAVQRARQCGSTLQVVKKEDCTLNVVQIQVSGASPGEDSCPGTVLCVRRS